MDILHKHKKRMESLKRYKSTSHIKEVETRSENLLFLNQEVDDEFIKKTNLGEVYSLDQIDYSVSEKEVNNLIVSLEHEASTDNILEPVFLSLFDGVMRAFKIGTNQGITASRLYQECKYFDYTNVATSSVVDSYTQYQIEQENIGNFDKTTTYSKGKLIRDNEQPLGMRDADKMKQAKKEHFDGNMIAPDDYNPDESIFVNKKHAKSQNKGNQSAEVDHVLSCSEICNNLKANKALNPDDIKDIVNVDENLAITSKHNNRGVGVGKFDKNQKQLQEEIDQGFVLTKKGKKIKLTAKDKRSRKQMINEMGKAQKAIERKANIKVSENILRDSKTQKRLTDDASNAAGQQAVGELIIALIKPLYYELKDCFQNGIENGVGEASFKEALKKRFARMKVYITENAEAALKGGLLNFFKNFFTMLLEGIVNCFVGIFKQVIRVIKEGIKVLLQIVPILMDSNKSAAEKGDAILKLFVGSATIFASIGIESWLNSIGLPEPWSIILSSVLSAVITALAMYLLDRLDLFGVNRDLKLKRISEVLSLKNEEVSSNLNNLILMHT